MPPSAPQDYLAEVDLEYARWSEITALIHMLTPDECLAPGYFRDPDWSVKDLVAHLGAWLEEAATQLTDIAARSYEPHDVNIDARNADALAATRNQSWETVWTHATLSRAYMLQHWFALHAPSDAANGGFARPARSIMVNTYRRSERGSPNSSMQGPARPATSGIRRYRHHEASR